MSSTCKSKRNVSFYIPPSLELTLPVGPTGRLKTLPIIAFERCTSGLGSSTRAPIHRSTAGFLRSRLGRGHQTTQRGENSSPNWQPATLFSSNDFTSVFFFLFFSAADSIFRSCCRSSLGLFSPLHCSANHRAASRLR